MRIFLCSTQLNFQTLCLSRCCPVGQLVKGSTLSTNSAVTPGSSHSEKRGSQCYRGSSLVDEEGLVPVGLEPTGRHFPVLFQGLIDLVLNPYGEKHTALLTPQLAA